MVFFRLLGPSKTSSYSEITFGWRRLRQEKTGINAKILKSSSEWRRILIDLYLSPNLSFISLTVSEKIDAEVTNTAFSI